MPVTLPVLREFSEALVDIHGQHEHQSLLKSDKQRELLDRFGNHLELTRQVQRIAEEYRKLTQTIESNQTSVQLRDERRDFLRYQLNELETLQLQPNEWQKLEAEHQQLAHADSLLQNLTQAVADLSQQEDKNILSQLHRVMKALDAVKQVSPQIEAWATAVNTAAIQLDDTSNEIHHYLDTLDLNPERLQWVEQRMQSLHDLARKYKVTPPELPALIEKIGAELGALENNDQHLADLQKKQAEILQEYKRLANQLSEKRQKAGKKLAKEITQTIQTLALPHAEFQIELLQIELVKEDEHTVSPYGLEKITFVVKTNRGADLHPLAKIASGGELSRISLAIHLATAEQYTIPTLIFDEVDVGIGGGIAELVGRLIRRLGKTHQVLCITHLPQVAAYGNHHISVEKIEKKDQTATELRCLSIKDKVKEIARMLGGINITATTLKHAEEMLGAVSI
jgi:DNA repair protein RecN (Recombination protein N)